MLTGIVDLAEDMFNLPARIGVPKDVGGVSERIRNPRYSTAIGLLQLSNTGETRKLLEVRVQQEEQGESVIAKFKNWLRNNF